MTLLIRLSPFYHDRCYLVELDSLLDKAKKPRFTIENLPKILQALDGTGEVLRVVNVSVHIIEIMRKWAKVAIMRSINLWNVV